ncbi:MAG: hypothetical protein KKB62_02985 [Nanoarchaeota archaeon]|nr:hypothetical protein [Nanoarchaeota archaeon]
MAKKKEEEISQNWFEDHESYDEEEEEEGDEELSEEDLEEAEEALEREEEFNSRVRHFLANQKRDVSLENIVDIPPSSLEEMLPKKKEEDEKSEENLDYLSGNKIEGMKYQAFEPDTKFSRPDMSSTERILEEQKAFYNRFKSAAENIVGENKSDWNPITPEDTIKKDYLTKRKI